MTRYPHLHFTVSERHDDQTRLQAWPQAAPFPRKASGEYFTVENRFVLPAEVMLYILRHDPALGPKATVH